MAMRDGTPDLGDLLDDEEDGTGGRRPMPEHFGLDQLGHMLNAAFVTMQHIYRREALDDPAPDTAVARAQRDRALHYLVWGDDPDAPGHTHEPHTVR